MLTRNEWLANAPAEVRQDLELAARARASLLDKVISALVRSGDSAVRAKARAVYAGLSAGQLRVLADALPASLVANAAPRQGAAYTPAPGTQYDDSL